MPDAGSACAFCRIADGAADAHVVHETAGAVVFLDRSPLFHGHVLVVPRTHVVTLADLPVDDVGAFFGVVQHVASRLPAAVGAHGTFVANNNVVSQSVAHLHVHVVPRVRGDGLRGFFWPRRRYGDGEADTVARQIRRALAAGPDQ